MIFAILLLIFLFGFASTTQATPEYELHYQSIYRVLPNESTFVQHQIKLINQLANIYPTSYAISIGTINLQNIQVRVNQYKVKPKIELGQNYTTIIFPITQPQIGKDKTNLIQISYFNPNILEKLGSNYEINLPKLSKANEAKTYLRTLIVPKTFPNKYLATPKPTKFKSEEHQLVFNWNNSPNQSITLLFGESQTYQLQLNYQLQTNQTSQFTEIALPPDTPYQRVYLDSIEPQPQFITTDADGNWLAKYQLDKSRPNVVKVKLFVQVYPQPHFELKSSNQNFDYLLKSTQYWPLKDSQVKQLAHQLKTPFNIYNYLVNNFIYNYNRSQRTQRLGAAKALRNPQLTICTEFTDSFVALSRSLGIPAREINGYAYTNNKQLKPLDLTQDVLHAWPEYLDPQTQIWRSVDPTWGNTTGGIDYFHKLDFNHIVFVRHGQEDNYPLPAGAYKNNKDLKTILVQPIDQPPLSKETFEIKNNQVINTGNLALINKSIKLPNGEVVHIDYLPPYGHYSFQIKSTTSFKTYLQPQFLLISLSLIIIFSLAVHLFKKDWHKSKL